MKSIPVMLGSVLVIVLICTKECLSSRPGRAFPIEAENFAVEQFKSVNGIIQWDISNYLVDLSGRFANCKNVGIKGTLRVHKKTPEGGTIIAVVDDMEGIGNDINSVNGFIKDMIKRWINQNLYYDQIKTGRYVGCSVRPGCHKHVIVACLFSPGTENGGEEIKHPTAAPTISGWQRGLAFTPQEYEMAEKITKTRWDRSHMLENLSGYETDCMMIVANEWHFQTAIKLAYEIGQRVFGLYGYTTNKGSTPAAIEDILYKFKRIPFVKQIGCSVIPDCMMGNSMYVVVSCLYEQA